MRGTVAHMGAPPPRIDADDDGNPLAVPDESSDVGQLIYLLEWARIRGFRVGPTIKIGELALTVEDLRQGRLDGDRTDDPGPWEAAGHTDRG